MRSYMSLIAVYSCWIIKESRTTVIIQRLLLLKGQRCEDSHKQDGLLYTFYKNCSNSCLETSEIAQRKKSGSWNQPKASGLDSQHSVIELCKYPSTATSSTINFCYFLLYDRRRGICCAPSEGNAPLFVILWSWMYVGDAHFVIASAIVPSVCVLTFMCVLMRFYDNDR